MMYCMAMKTYFQPLFSTVNSGITEKNSDTSGFHTVCRTGSIKSCIVNNLNMSCSLSNELCISKLDHPWRLVDLLFCRLHKNLDELKCTYAELYLYIRSSICMLLSFRWLDSLKSVDIQALSFILSKVFRMIQIERIEVDWKHFDKRWLPIWHCPVWWK